GGPGCSVVLRRYVRPELNAEEPDLAEREARALQVAAGIALATPELLAVDPTGADAGVPSVLMSCLAGRVEWRPAELERWLGRLAELLPPIHGVDLPPTGTLPPYAPYRPDSDAPPAWSSRPRVWERAVELAHGPPPDDRPVVVHRDFHPGNVLWRRGKVSGLVDWQAASVGPGSVDVGHCRVNLLRFGLDAAGAFTRHWERLTGLTYDPWADVVAVVGFLDGLRDDPGSDAHLFETLLARAIVDLNRP
ncbi:MAG: phosphotransferase family protein, partial [Acidimicrobiales bacterium]